MIKQPFVVLAGSHREDMLTVNHHDEAGLFAGEEVFNYDPRACGAKAVVFEHFVDGLMSFLFCHGDNNALASR